ncbi:methyl-accepting chemotaxis protein [Pseudomonas asiatica]|uniref:Methyl-accepting chemotaxis protein n=1 Tax=Pseudomonas asiatica TaxID=2219225 RepID=A0ABU5KVV8_9PSED|nr:methyl-accepting chemotaxis protein [Pseudomonas asiatica]MDZ5738062.1 methyl-accepting chemotaxis protein [Pseudomonas asiatica]MDZ5744658.1 methyl-accepting chemotaxis protein [Pseudomonas asiatica]MDZ5748818.1 methyl-accepting chemotaxis protein [Pseudomonas asiatica]MDZ5753150.1 methyl-accepting chemotaxis protein [Pseudomonas asiatica]
MKPPIRKHLPMAAGLLVLGAIIAFQQYQLSTLSGVVNGAAEKTSIDALQSRVSAIDDRLDTVSGKPLVTMEDFRVSQQALSSRIDAVQATARQAQDIAIEVTRSSATAGDLLVLRADLEALDGKLEKVSKPQAQAAAPAPKASPAKPKPKPSPVKSTPVPQEPPPFQMVGLEYRGGERFLSVAPTGSTRLSQIYLIRPGEMVSGSSWRLKAVDERTATFDAGGKTRTLSIQP